MHGVLGPNAPKHVEEELDTALEKLNKKHKTEENHALEVPTEQFLVTNKAVQVFFCNMTINGHLIVMYLRLWSFYLYIPSFSLSRLSVG